MRAARYASRCRRWARARRAWVWVAASPVKNFLALATIAAGVTAAAACQARQARSPQPLPAGSVLAVTNVTVVDMNAATDAGALRLNQTVVMQDGRIADAGPADRVTVPRDSLRIDGRKRFLIPGLWDSHSHVSLAGEAGLLAYLASGVTTVRDLGSQISVLAEWRAAMQRRTLAGPEILTSGPAIEAAWWLDPALGLLAKDAALSRFPIVEVSPALRLGSPGDAPGIVDEITRAGADVIKFRNLRGDEFRAVAAEAVRRGLMLAGHAPSGVGVGEAAELGLRTFEHAETVTARLGTADASSRLAELTRVAKAGASITPTLVTDVAFRQTSDDRLRAIIGDSRGRIDARRQYIAPMLLRRWQFGLDLKRYEGSNDWAALYRRELADLRQAHAAGVPLLVGTDLGVPLVYPGFSVHDELSLLVTEVGLSPFEALKAATINAARAMRVDGTSGSIAPGRRADAVLLNANPLADIGSLATIESVIVRGHLLTRDQLNALLRRASTLASP